MTLPLAQAYNLDISAICNRLEISRLILKQRNVEIVEASLKALGESQGAFLEAVKLYKIALTITVDAALAERSVSALKQVETYLRSTMGQQRLNDLAVLAIEKDISKSLDY